MEYFNKVLDKVAQMYGWDNFEDVFHNGQYSTFRTILDETVEITNDTKKVWNVLDSDFNLLNIGYDLEEIKENLVKNGVKNFDDLKFIYTNQVLFDAQETPVCTCCGSLNLDNQNIADLYLCLDCEFLMYEPTQLKDYNYNTKQVKI